MAPGEPPGGPVLADADADADAVGAHVPGEPLGAPETGNAAGRLPARGGKGPRRPARRPGPFASRRARHPEWPVALLALIAWLAVVVLHGPAGPAGHHHSPGAGHEPPPTPASPTTPAGPDADPHAAAGHGLAPVPTGDDRHDAGSGHGVVTPPAEGGGHDPGGDAGRGSVPTGDDRHDAGGGHGAAPAPGGGDAHAHDVAAGHGPVPAPTGGGHGAGHGQGLDATPPGGGGDVDDLGDVARAAVAPGPLGAWALMSVAVMTPVTLGAVRHTARHSFPWRRPRAMTAYMAAYLGAWLALGPPALALVALARALGVSGGALVAALLVLSAGWQRTPWKRRAVRGCRWSRSLPPLGWRADLACLRFGAQQAGGCLVACWPLMLVMVAVGHHGWAAVGVMAALTGLLVAEERSHLRRPRAGVTAAALALLAPVVALAG